MENREKNAADTLLTELGIIGTGDDIVVILSDEPEDPVSHADGEIRTHTETALSERPEILQIKKDIKAKETELQRAGITPG